MAKLSQYRRLAAERAAGGCYDADVFCGSGTEDKSGAVLVEHFREFVAKVWESATPPGLTLILRPTVSESGKEVDFYTDWDKRVKCAQEAVFFFTEEQFKRLHIDHFKKYLWRSENGFQSVLVKHMEGGQKYLEVWKGLTKAALVKWFGVLQRINEECVVCYEDTGPGAKQSQACPNCAANICVQCILDITINAKHFDLLRAPNCPLCAIDFIGTFSKLCVDAFTDRTLTEAHKEFVFFWCCFEHNKCAKALNCDFSKMTAKMRDAIEVDFGLHLRASIRFYKQKLKVSRTKEDVWTNRSSVKIVEANLKKYPPLLRRALRKFKAPKVLTPLKSAADDSIATVAATVTAKPKPARARTDRCARCQKVFWTKKKKKRAPKCTKCKQVAYCSNACRKKHRATHSLQCPQRCRRQKEEERRCEGCQIVWLTTSRTGDY